MVPELPEVETVRAGLEHHVVGRTIAAGQVLHPRAVRRDPAGPDGFAAAIAGRHVQRAERRGKYLWLALGDDDALLAHLGMSGQMLVGDPQRPMSPHVRARFTFADGGPDLRFTDQRTFGHLMLVPFAHAASPADPPARVEPVADVVAVADVAAGAAARAAAEGGLALPGEDRARASSARLLPAPIAHIAPDPMEEAFDPSVFSARLRKRRTGVKRALLDQSLISGVGNIYADEALWLARVHWARATETLSPAEVTRLLAAVREVLASALRAGGTSFDSLYVNVNGESGYFARSLEAYGRAGQPCSRCGTPITRDSFMNRSSFSCPHCQPRPGEAHW